MVEYALTGYAVVIKRGDGQTPTEAFTEIAEVHNIDGPGMSRDAVDVGFGSDGFRRYMAGAADGGEVALELNFLPADTTQGATSGLLKDFMDGTLRNYKMEFPDTPKTIWSFAGIITKFNPTASFDKQITASVTIKISGKPTLA